MNTTLPKLQSTRFNRWLVGWSVLRLPVCVLAIYLFKDQFVSLFEQLFGLDTLVVRVIYLGSTLEERIIFFLISAIVLSVIFFSAQRLRSRFGKYGLPLVLSFGFFLILLNTFSTRFAILDALLLTGLLALNLLSEQWVVQFITHPQGRRVADWGFGVAIGLSELLLIKPFLLWLLVRSRQEVALTGIRRQILTVLPICVVSALAAFTLGSEALITLGQTLHADRAVEKFAKGDFNILAVAPQQHTLYASGRGVNHLLAYNTDQLKQRPRESEAETGYAQGFAYSPLNQELYVYNSGRDALESIDAHSLKVVRSANVSQVSPGDAWITWDRISDSVIIVSEADKNEGMPFVAVDRLTGKVVKELNLNSGNIFLNPTQPLLYLSSFRRTHQLLVYNTQTHEIVKSVPTDARVHRMAFDQKKNELLLASSLHAKVLRYDADTLEKKGEIKTVFSVRSVTVDAKRNLLLAGGLVNNMLDVIDLNTDKRIAQYYLGPWLREISLDTEAGIAYVSSNGRLYKVNYTDKL